MPGEWIAGSCDLRAVLRSGQYSLSSARYLVTILMSRTPLACAIRLVGNAFLGATESHVLNTSLLTATPLLLAQFTNLVFNKLFAIFNFTFAIFVI